MFRRNDDRFVDEVVTVVVRILGRKRSLIGVELVAISQISHCCVCVCYTIPFFFRDTWTIAVDNVRGALLCFGNDEWHWNPSASSVGTAKDGLRIHIPTHPFAMHNVPTTRPPPISAIVVVPSAPVHVQQRSLYMSHVQRKRVRESVRNPPFDFLRHIRTSLREVCFCPQCRQSNCGCGGP